MWSTERWGLASTVISNSAGQSILYAIGGKTATGASLGKVMAYNAATDTWSVRAPLPVPLFLTNGAAVIDGRIYISGGSTNSDTRHVNPYLFMYDPITDRWTRRRDMPTPSGRGVTGVINGRLYVLTTCGQTDESCSPPILQAFYRYNPLTDRWATLPVLPSSSHEGGVAGVIGSKFYVAGGNLNRRLDVYDPATNQWTPKAPMPKACFQAAGAALGGKLYVVGGRDGATSCETSVYDPRTNAWTTRSSPPTLRAEVSASRVVVGGQARIELVGGSRPGNNLQYVP